MSLWDVLPYLYLKFACFSKIINVLFSFNLGERNIISAVVHLDEEAPHLLFAHVVYIKDKDGNNIDKICARNFGKGQDIYRKLQDIYLSMCNKNPWIQK